ncbi:hypothetical protein Hdeb2414_s0014g00427871 [Helianthus debilis subsp. tardiflorus]
MEIQVAFQSQGTVGIGEPLEIRVLSGVQFLKDLDYLLTLCNKDTSPVTPALIISGCDNTRLFYFTIRDKTP